MMSFLNGAHGKKACDHSEAGFTRMELAVVLVVTALLTLVIYPALAATQREDQSAVCTSNLRQIGVGMLTFASENDDTFYTLPGGGLQNQGMWFRNPRATNQLPATDSYAYWGVPYFSYVGNSRRVFRCPSARIVDEWRETGLTYPSDFWLNSSYGVSQYITRSSDPSLSGVVIKISECENPSTKIVTQDAAEQAMDGADDMLGLWPGRTRILAQWVGPGGLSEAYYGGYDFTWEWYRHDQRCNTLWLSGHVSKIPFTGLTVGIDYRYYTGETPVLPLPEP